jgi:N-acetylglucosamine-6-phosphate deacetylase
VKDSLGKLLVWFLILVVPIALVGACSWPSGKVTVITHVTLIDATGAPPRQDSAVMIMGVRISAVGSSGSFVIPSNATIIDGTGKFLIPGLADMHLHLTGASEPNGSREFILPLLLANGITTARDMGGKVEFLKALRKEIDTGKRLGPQIFFTGPYLDGQPPSFQPSIVVRNAGEAVAAVDILRNDGVDFIKVQSRLQPESYFALAAESKKLTIRFVGHVPDSITAAQASVAGQASIEHLTGVLLGLSTREEELRGDKLKPAKGRIEERAWLRRLLNSVSDRRTHALLEEFKRNGTWQVPTFPLLVHIGFLTPRTDLAEDPRLRFIPGDLRAIWKKGRKALLEGYTDEDFALREAIIQESLEVVGKMSAAGVPIMAGTDTTAPNVFPGFSLHEDLEYLVKAGLTPMQALQAATSKPAEFLGRSAGQGTIQVGKRADLVLLDGDPLVDIRNTQKIRAVVVNGKLLDRSELDRLLAGVERFAKTH